MREMFWSHSGADVGVQDLQQQERPPRHREDQGLHCWVGAGKRGRTKVQALEGGGAGKKLLRGRSTAADRAPGVGN